MTILSRLVSYPRNRYLEDGHNLDLAFITDDICVMSLPSVSWPERLYRNNLSHVKALLDAKAGTGYKIFEFRAEGAGYEDSDFDGRVAHFPFVDHHPPPFRLLPKIVDAMQNHLAGNDASVDSAGKKKKIAVLHCKAGKGRSGLGTCSFLVTHRGWTEQDARTLFTAKRMRAGFGEGVSIPSQRRYLRYVERWARDGRRYEERDVRIQEIRVRNLGAGCRLTVRAFADEGKEIRTVHTFADDEITLVDGVTTLKPKRPIALQSDACVYLSKGKAFAHFWFNAYFEALNGQTHFSIDWKEVDGWKGTQWRGVMAYESVDVRWTVV